MTGLWALMLCIALVIPLKTLFIGLYFKKHIPENIITSYGHVSARSVKNLSTWKFANDFYGKTSLKVGIVLMLATIVAMLFCIGKTEMTIIYFGLTAMVVQAIAAIGVYFFVEWVLKKNFDQNGEHKG